MLPQYHRAVNVTRVGPVAVSRSPDCGKTVYTSKRKHHHHHHHPSLQTVLTHALGSSPLTTVYTDRSTAVTLGSNCSSARQGIPRMLRKCKGLCPGPEQHNRRLYIDYTDNVRVSRVPHNSVGLQGLYQDRFIPSPVPMLYSLALMCLQLSVSLCEMICVCVCVICVFVL
jgi:hypothetical protein